MLDQGASAILRWRAPCTSAGRDRDTVRNRPVPGAHMVKADGTALPSSWRGLVRAGRACGSIKDPSRRGQSESSPGTKHRPGPVRLPHALPGRPDAATETSPKRPGPVPGRLRSGRSPAAPGRARPAALPPPRGRAGAAALPPAPLPRRSGRGRLRRARPTAAVRAGPGRAAAGSSDGGGGTDRGQRRGLDEAQGAQSATWSAEGRGTVGQGRLQGKEAAAGKGAVRRCRGWEELVSVIRSFPVTLARSHLPVRLPSFLHKLRVREELGCPTARFDAIVPIDCTGSPTSLKLKPRQSIAPNSSLPPTPLLPETEHSRT